MALAACGVLLAGCTTAAAPDAPPQFTLTVLQYRSDIPLHRVELHVGNPSGRDVRVDRVVLTGSGYSPAPTWSKAAGSTVRGGTEVDLPAVLTSASCDAALDLHATIRLADGRTATVRATDSHATLASLRASDCFAQDVAEQATIAFDGFEPGVGRHAELVVAVQPKAGAVVTIGDVLGTTLLCARDTGALWHVDRRIATGTRLVLPAVPTRCDLHAVAEDKIGTVLQVEVRLADGRHGTVETIAPPALKNRIIAWVVDSCASNG